MFKELLVTFFEPKRGVFEKSKGKLCPKEPLKTLYSDCQATAKIVAVEGDTNLAGIKKEGGSSHTQTRLVSLRRSVPCGCEGSLLVCKYSQEVKYVKWLRDRKTRLSKW